jgi:hypothetical protein
VPAERLEQKRGLLGGLPSLRPEIVGKPISRKGDELSCVRFGVGPLLGAEPAHWHHRADQRGRGPGAGARAVTGQVVAEHALVAPGETGIVDEHYGRAPGQAPPRAASQDRREKQFLILGEVAARRRGAGVVDQSAFPQCAVVPSILLAAAPRAAGPGLAFGAMRCRVAPCRELG